MMKGKPLYLCLIIFLQFAFGGTSAGAASIRFNPDAASQDGMLAGRVFIERLGRVKLPHGRALFRGNSVDIAIVPEFQFDRVIVLTGALLNTRVDIKEGIVNAGTVQQPYHQQAVFTGTIYFFEGDWLKYIDDPRTLDSVVTTSGIIAGRIKGITMSGLEIEEENGSLRLVPIDTLVSVRSPRAFEFYLKGSAIGPFVSGKPFVADATNVNLNPTMGVFELKALKQDRLMQNDGDLSVSKLILIGAAYSTAQLAQMLPFLLVPLNSGYYIRNANAKINRYFVESNFQQQTGLLNPIPPPGFPQRSPGG